MFAGRVIMVAVGVLLIAAGVLKAVQHSIAPGLRESFFGSEFEVLFVVEFELVLGFALLCGFFVTMARRISVAVFCLYAWISLFQAVSGKQHCGCFGPIPVHPLVMFFLDAVVVAATYWTDPLEFSNAPRSIPLVLSMTGIGLLSCASAGIAIVATTPEALQSSSGSAPTGEVLVLKPDRWVGERLPVIDWLEDGKAIAKGQWLLLFGDRDCPLCKEVFDDLTAESEAYFLSTGFRWKIAHVDINPFGSPRPGANEPRDGNCLELRLSTSKTWIGNPPMVIRLNNGIVESTGRSGRDVRRWLALP